MDYCGIKEYLKGELERVNAVIRESLASDIELLNKTNQSLLDHSGKQLRPVLALLVAKACSGGFVTEDTIHYAAAAELLHNATLLHDDVADGSFQRRGCPTVMSLLGGRASVLLGDFWLVKAMHNILQSDNSSSQVIRLFSKTLSDLAEGEMLQLQKAASCDTKEPDYYRIIFSKTASLFEAAAISAAISVGASAEKKKAVKNYARSLGIAFQIKDDILDYDGDESIGKPVGLDLMEKKMTLPLLGALSKADKAAADTVRHKVSMIEEIPDAQKDIVDFVRQFEGVDYARARLGEYVDNAKIFLRALGRGLCVDMLGAIADFVAERKS
ncbi:MAG: polyprenyl synthetase family protein [Candidatus Cryptobacteroides sp.]